MATGVPAWHEIRVLVARALDEPVHDGQPLTPPRTSRMTWAARTPGTGAIVVKARRGDSAFEKTQWCAEHLPALGARGYPVPAILWHGTIGDEWHVTVQNRLPGRPLEALDGRVLEAVLRMVELQADAGLQDEERDFTGYVANVLFEDWDEVWADAPRASEAAGPLCSRLRRWLAPVWGMRLPPADFSNNDLNLSNILADGSRITGVVDWDEFALGSRALDLVALAIDGERGGDHATADRLLAQAARVAGRDGLRCLVSYRAIALLAHSARERDAYGDSLAGAECAAISAVLDTLEAQSIGRRRRLSAAATTVVSMADFVDADLRGARFEHVDLSGAQLRDVDLAGARFADVDLSGVVMRGVELANVSIHGELLNVTVNGVDIAPLVDAELNRRYPDRAKMRPDDPAGFREAWDLLGRLWEQTVGRARRLPPELLHESVDGEWSFIETVRHLVFATDCWIRRAVLGDPSPWDPLGLPWDGMPDTPGVPRDRGARPSLDVVLELRRDRMSTVRQVIENLTSDSLDSRTQPVEGPGWPPPRSYPVRECLLVVLNEEWEHRLYAERDLAALEAGRP